MMELEWEREQPSRRLFSVLVGATLGAVLGADCFLAVDYLLGPPAAVCGAAAALFAVKGGALLSGRDNRLSAALALLPVIPVICAAHQLSAALTAAPGNPEAVWQAFACWESLAALDYWPQLALLLLTAFSGWGFLFVRSGQLRELERRAMEPCRNVPPPSAGMEVFLPRQAWIRPFLLEKRIFQGLWLAMVCLCVWLRVLVGHEQILNCAIGGMVLSPLFLLSLQSLPSRMCAAANILYVRKDGRLWRVAADRIRYPDLMAPLCRLTRIWERLPRERKDSLLNTIEAVSLLESAAAHRIKDPELDWQSKWMWGVSDCNGTKIVIPKVYPNFTPVPGDSERAKEPPPMRWTNLVCALALTMICLAAGCGIGIQTEQRASLLAQEPVTEESGETAEAGTVARVPEKIAYYTLNGLSLQTDSMFQVDADQFLDVENHVDYLISLQYGVGEEAALSALEKTTAARSRYLQPDGEDFLWGMGENGVAYRYNLRSAYLKDGQVFHTGAALSERGTLIVIEASHGGRANAETVRGNLLYMLENLQFTGPAITEETYQDQLRPAVEMGFYYCGQAFFKAPPEMFGYDAYIDTFLPCGGVVNYYDGGVSMMTKVHGLRVSAAAVPCDGTAMDVVDRAYQALKEAGRRYDESSILEDAYNAEGDTACRAAVYYEGNRARATVLYASARGDGWYIFKELTCLPEEIDEEYPAFFREMEAADGFSVSHMETLRRSGEQQESGAEP